MPSKHATHLEWARQQNAVDFELSAGQTLLQQTIRQFAANVIQPVGRDRVKTGRYPTEILEGLKLLGGPERATKGGAFGPTCGRPRRLSPCSAHFNKGKRTETPTV